MSSVASSSSLVFTTHRRGQPRIERKTTFRCSSASWSAQEYSDEKKRLKMRALSEAHKSFLGRWHRDASKNENETCSNTSKRTIWTGIAPRRRTCKFGTQQQMRRRIRFWERERLRCGRFRARERKESYRTLWANSWKSTKARATYSAQGREKCTEKPRGI